MSLRYFFRILCGAIATGSIMYAVLHDLMRVTIPLVALTVIPLTALLTEFLLVLGFVQMRHAGLTQDQQVKHAWSLYKAGVSIIDLYNDVVEEKERRRVKALQQREAETQRKQEEAKRVQETERKKAVRYYMRIFRKAKKSGVGDKTMEAIRQFLREGRDDKARQLIEAVRSIRPVYERAYNVDQATGDRVVEMMSNDNIDAIEPTLLAAERRRDLLVEAQTHGIQDEIRRMIEAGDEAGAKTCLGAVRIQSEHRRELSGLRVRVEALLPEVGRNIIYEYLAATEEAVEDERSYRKAWYYLHSALVQAEETQRLRSKVRHRSA